MAKLTVPYSGEDVEQQELSLIADMNTNVTATLENSRSFLQS